MGDLSFIGDDELRKTLEDSIEYVYALYEQSKGDGQSKLFRDETHRVIVLYVVSAIEAVLLYLYKTRGEKIEYIEYKCIHALPTGYTNTGKTGLPVVIAVQEKVEKREHQIGIHELVTFFETKKLITSEMSTNIREINDVRNTFHFSKPRTKITCDLERVESALSILVGTLAHAPKVLKKRMVR